MSRRAGFTLIELLLVLAIIGIISAIAIPALLGQRERAKMQATKDNALVIVAELQTIVDALQDNPSERRSDLSMADYSTDMSALATEAIREVVQDNPNYARARNPYQTGSAYVQGAAQPSNSGTVGFVYLDPSSVNASGGGAIIVTGNIRDQKGAYQALVKYVSVQ